MSDLAMYLVTLAAILSLTALCIAFERISYWRHQYKDLLENLLTSERQSRRERQRKEIDPEAKG